MARVEDLDDDEIGLSAPTINRHRTQLSTILAHMEENGYPIGVVSKKSLAKDTRSPDEKRRPFTVEDGRTLIARAHWSMVDQEGMNIRPLLEDTGAQFWVFLLAWYMLMRLGEACGLMVCEVDLALENIALRNNKLRRVKNKPYNRELPIHPELLRLRFAEFVKRQKALGHEILFPELHGSATAVSRGNHGETSRQSGQRRRPCRGRDGDRDRPAVRRPSSSGREALVPGHHVTDHQMRLFMQHRQTDTVAVAAAKASMSRATGHRIAKKARLPSTSKVLRGRRPQIRSARGAALDRGRQDPSGYRRAAGHLRADRRGPSPERSREAADRKHDPHDRSTSAS